MHNVFAKNRVSGEWFEFASETEIDSAKTKGAELAAQVASYKEVFIKADKLDTVASQPKAKSSDPEIDRLAAILQTAKSELKILADLDSEVSAQFTEAVASGKDTKGASKTTSRVFQGKFDRERFEAENSSLFAKYLVETKKWNHTFLFKLKTFGLERLSEDFQAFVEETKSSIAKAKSADKIEDLNEVTLSISHKKALAEWDAELAIAELKNACGKFEEVTGICTWKRFESSTTAFSESALKAAEPDLYNSYVGDATEKKYVRPTKVKLK
jgi:hypothetical protein